MPLLVFVGGLAAWRGLLPNVAIWDVTTMALLRAVQLVGPLTAGLASWSAGRDRRRRMGYVRQLGVRSPGLIPLFQMASLAIWAIAAFVVVAVALIAKTTAEGGYGRPSILGLIAAVLGIVVHVSVGYVIGLPLPRLLVPLLVTLAAYGYVVWNLDQAGESFYLLSPVTVEQADAFHSWRSGLFSHQVLWYLLLVITIVVAMATALDRRRRLLVALVTSIASTAIAGVAVMKQGGQFFGPTRTATDLRCVNAAIAVCVHPAYAAGLPELIRQLSPVAERLRNTRSAVSRFEQAPPEVNFHSAITRAIHLDDLRVGYAQEAASEFAQGLLDITACQYSNGRPERVRLSALVVMWLSCRLEATHPVFPEERHAARLVSTMKESERRSWLATHYEEFRTCRLSVEDFRL